MRSPLVHFAGALALAACGELLCGEGTIEIDGVCVSMGAAPECGPGTHFDATSGRCVNDDFTGGVGVCGPGTSLEISDAGVPTCVGLGGGGGCDAPLPCPPPEGQQTVSLCGRIHDLETSAPLDDGVAENGEPWKTVEIRIFDPFAFIANPDTTPLMKGLPDSCGRYALLEVPRPVAGIVALAVDDIDAENGQPVFGDDLVQTGIADTIAAGDVRVGQRAWILRRTTDAAWSQAAGFTDPQMSFGRRGVYIPIFLGPGTAPAPFPGNPTENVQVAIIDNGQRTVRPDSDYYFDDTDPLQRATVSPARAQTGRNGTALYINQPGIASFSGLGALPEGVCWRTDPAAAPVGAAFVQERGPGPQFCTQ
jgi:hypothetical protein